MGRMSSRGGTTAVVYASEPAGAGVTVSVTFTVDEALALPPSVTLQAVAGSPWQRVAANGLTYIFEFVPSGDEPPGNQPIVAQLVDLFGNEASGVGVATLTLDFDPPGLVGSLSASDAFRSL